MMKTTKPDDEDCHKTKKQKQKRSKRRRHSHHSNDKPRSKKKHQSSSSSSSSSSKNRQPPHDRRSSSCTDIDDGVGLLVAAKEERSNRIQHFFQQFQDMIVASSLDSLPDNNNDADADDDDDAGDDTILQATVFDQTKQNVQTKDMKHCVKKLLASCCFSTKQQRNGGTNQNTSTAAVVGTVTVLTPISACLFLAASSGNLQAVTLILEQCTKWNRYVKQQQQRRKKKKHSRSTTTRTTSSRDAITIDIHTLINSTEKGVSTNTGNRNSTTNNYSLLTVLHIACFLEQGAMAAVFVQQYAANVHVQDANGDSPLSLGVLDLIRQHENTILHAEADARAQYRDCEQHRTLQAEQISADQAWRERLANADTDDGIEHGMGSSTRNSIASRAGATEEEQKWGQGWDNTTTEAVLQAAGGSEGDWWGQIAAERTQKQRRAAAAAAKSWTSTKTAAATTDTAHRNQQPTTSAFDTGTATGKTKVPPSSTATNNNVPSCTVETIDPIQARAQDNRKWSIFMKSWSIAAVMTVTDNHTTTVNTETTATVTSPHHHPSMTMLDIPWPCAGDDVPFPGAALLAPGERKVYHRQLQRRWHPDKFAQQFGSSIRVHEEREKILKRVTAVFQSIHETRATTARN